MKKKTDSRHSEVQFEVGDQVLVKLNKYRQNFEKIGEVAIRVQLPTGAKIHNVFHSSLLKKFVLGESAEAALLPRDLVELEDNLGSEDTGVDTPSTVPLPQPKRQRRVSASHDVYKVDYVGSHQD